MTPTLWQRFAVFIENHENIDPTRLGEKLKKSFGGGVAFLLLANGMRPKGEGGLDPWVQRFTWAGGLCVGWVNAFAEEATPAEQARYHSNLVRRYGMAGVLCDAEDSFAYSQPAGFDPKAYEASDKYVEAVDAFMPLTFPKCLTSYPPHTKDLHWGAWRSHKWRLYTQNYFEVDSRFAAAETFRKMTLYDKGSTHCAYRNQGLGGPGADGCIHDAKYARQFGFSWGVAVYEGEQMTDEEWEKWRVSGLYRREF